MTRSAAHSRTLQNKVKTWSLSAMKRLFWVVFFCQVGLGQTVYSGQGFDSGTAIFGNFGSSCGAPNFCAYAGVDVIPWGTVPDLGGATNNNATVYDTSYIGGCPYNPGGVCYNRDGTVFNDYTKLSPVTRVTDVNSGS